MLPARSGSIDEAILPEVTMGTSNVPVPVTQDMQEKHINDAEKPASPGAAVDPDSPPAAFDRLRAAVSADTAIAQDQHNYPTLSRWRAICIPLLCMSGTFQQASAVVGVALGIKEIGLDLSIPQYQLQWLQSSVTLAYACTLLLFGRCADIWGHKLFFTCGLLCAGIFNMACGLAQTSIQMFVFRALTGAMFACVVPSALGILAHSYRPGPAKSRAFACFAAGAPIGNAVGLLIAGFTIRFASTRWRTFFYVSAGLTALTGALGIFIVPGPMFPNRRLKGQAVDVVGAFLATAGLVLFVFALADGEGAPQGWKSAYIPITLVIGVLVLAAFVGWERWLEKKDTLPPLMRISVWLKGKFWVVQAVALSSFGAITSIIFWMTLYWQNYEEVPILEMTARFVPLSIAGVSVNVVGALLVAHVSGQILLSIGLAASALSALLFAINDPSVTYWAYQFPACVLSIWAADAIMLCGTLYVSKIVRPEDQAQGASIFNTITQLGGSITLAITTIVSDSVQKKHAASMGVFVHGTRDTATVIPKEALLKGYRAAFWTCFAFLSFGLLLTVVLLRDMGKVGAKKAKKVVDKTELQV